MFEIGNGEGGAIVLAGRFDAAQVEKARRFLDGAVPLATGAWSEATGIRIDDGQLLRELPEMK